MSNVSSISHICIAVISSYTFNDILHHFYFEFFIFYTGYSLSQIKGFVNTKLCTNFM